MHDNLNNRPLAIKYVRHNFAHFKLPTVLDPLSMGYMNKIGIGHSH